MCERPCDLQLMGRKVPDLWKNKVTLFVRNLSSSLRSRREEAASPSTFSGWSEQHCAYPCLELLPPAGRLDPCWPLPPASEGRFGAWRFLMAEWWGRGRQQCGRMSLVQKTWAAASNNSNSLQDVCWKLLINRDHKVVLLWKKWQNKVTQQCQ